MLKKITKEINFIPRCATCDERATYEESQGGGYYNYYCGEECRDKWEDGK